MPNKLSQFWHELKRRNVVRVITVYAGAAFVIIELINNITEPLKLPEWTPTLVIVLLAIGFPIAIIFSWIYDIHPEGGMVKTEATDKVKVKEIPKSSNGWKIASYVSFVVIVGLIVLNVIPRPNSNRKVLEKSIAVLPLEYLSEDPNKEYLANGVLDAITGHLSLIEGLRVMPRTSVEQYRENRKSAKEIGEELDVSYLIEGSFLMVGNQVKLTIQLVIAAEGDHVFFKEYDREYKDILAVQSEVAQTIAGEIEVAITPEEIERIEKIPTTSLTAYDFYQRGRSAYEAFQQGTAGREALERAEDNYFKALEYDSTFAQAYTGLALVYQSKHMNETYFSENFLDSLLIFADKALSINPQLSEAFVVKGNYYRENNKIELALKEYDNAIKYNPNNWEAYRDKASLYGSGIDIVLAIENLTKAITLYRGPSLPNLFRTLGYRYVEAGFKKKAYYYASEALKLDDDSAAYLRILTGIEGISANFEKSIEYAERYYSIDSTNSWIVFNLGMNYSNLGQYEKSLEYYKKLQKDQDTLEYWGWADNIRIGYAYLLNGYEKEAEAYFLRGSELHNKRLELSRHGDFTSYYLLAANFAIKGDTAEVYECLRLYSQVPSTPYWMLKDFLYDSLFDSIRDEPEFQQILSDVKANHQATHERVRQWLEENDML